MTIPVPDFPQTGLRVLVDADSCPVKEEIQKVGFRRGVPMLFVANQYMRLPVHPLVKLMVVGSGFDEADDRIAEAAGPGAVVITADILLADRCLKAGASAVLSPKGAPFDEASIGGAVAVRAIMADLRAGVGAEGLRGPAPFAKADRSRFLNVLETALAKAARG